MLNSSRIFSKVSSVKSMFRLGSTLISSDLSDFELQHKTPPIRKSPPIPIALYGGRHTVTLIPGSGIGPELMGYVREIFKQVHAPVDFEEVNVDTDCDNNDDLDYALISIKRNGVAIKGNIETKCKHYAVALRNIAIRNELDLYLYVLNCKSYPGVQAKHSDVDIVVVRQNTEGEYSMLEHESVPGMVENLKVITESNTRRVAKYAFEYAKKHGRKKVTTVHKANIMKLSDGLFLQTARNVAKEYPEIKHDDIIIDNCCMQLVSKPQQFDVLITTNLYGNIVANVLCGLCGGPGILSGKNYGDHYAIFEPGTRGLGRVLTGMNNANPVAMLNASIDMLHHLGHAKYGNMIQDAIFKTICEDGIHTPDLGGCCSSTDVVENIMKHLQQQ